MFENIFLYAAYADDSTYFLTERSKLSQGTTEYNQLLFIFYGFKNRSI